MFVSFIGETPRLYRNPKCHSSESTVFYHNFTGSVEFRNTLKTQSGGEPAQDFTNTDIPEGGKMINKKSFMFTIRITRELMDKLRRLSDEKELSMSDLVRRLLLEKLEKEVK